MQAIIEKLNGILDEMDELAGRFEDDGCDSLAAKLDAAARPLEEMRDTFTEVAPLVRRKRAARA